MKKDISKIEAPVNRSEEVLYQILIRLDELTSLLQKDVIKSTPTKKKVVKKDDIRKTITKS